MSEPAFLYVIDLSASNNGVYTLNSHDEVLTWIREELNFWTFLNGLQPQAYHRYNDNLNQLLRLTGGAEAEFRRNWQSHASNISNAYRTMIHRSSPKGAFIGSLQASAADANDTGARANAVKMAAAATAYLMGALLDMANDPTVMRGVREAQLWEEKQPSQLRASASAVETLFDNLSKWYSERKAEVTAELTAAATTRAEIANFQTETLAGIKAMRADHVKAFAEMQAKFQSECDARQHEVTDAAKSLEALVLEMMEQATTDLESFKKGMLDRTALGSTISYWKGRVKRHGGWTIAYSVLFLAAAGFGSWGLIEYIRAQFPLDQLFEWPKLPIGKIGLTAVLLTLGLWIMKTLIRLFLTHQHLATDAAERVTMIETYLALRQEGKIEASDRELMLRPIFRRGISGMHEGGDSPPLVMTEIVNQARGKVVGGE